MMEAYKSLHPHSSLSAPCQSTLPSPLSPPRIDTMAFALASRVAAVRPTAVAGRRSAVVARPARIAGAVVSGFLGGKEIEFSFFFGGRAKKKKKRRARGGKQTSLLPARGPFRAPPLDWNPRWPPLRARFAARRVMVVSGTRRDERKRQARGQILLLSWLFPLSSTKSSSSNECSPLPRRLPRRYLLFPFGCEAPLLLPSREMSAERGRSPLRSRMRLMGSIKPRSGPRPPPPPPKKKEEKKKPLQSTTDGSAAAPPNGAPLAAACSLSYAPISLGRPKSVSLPSWAQLIGS